LVELDAQEAQAARAREAASQPSAGLDEERLARILADEEKAAKRAAPGRAEPRASPPPLRQPGSASAPQAPSDPAPRSADTPSSAGSSAIAEGQSFEAMYTGAEVPPSPYPAEKLLKLLDGLRAMDAGTRKAAILAMDAADDAWTIDDVVLDAERKCRTLALGIERVEAQSAAVDDRVKSEVTSLEQYTQQAAETIRRQIAELEALLQDELQKAATRRAELQMETRAAREAAARERARYEQEIERLREIGRIFAPPPPPSV
jgi:hypothetical protein